MKMIRYHMERMEEAFDRVKLAATEISVRVCKADIHLACDDDLHQLNVYAQFASELRELIGRYGADLAEFKKPSRIASTAIGRAVNEVLNGVVVQATMRQFRGKGGA